MDVVSHRRIATVVAVLCVAGFTAVPVRASTGAAGARDQTRYPNEPVAVGTGGAVASMDVGASRAGIDVVRRGGNAVDAAVATASALGVTVPFVAGPGGGKPLLWSRYPASEGWPDLRFDRGRGRSSLAEGVPR